MADISITWNGEEAKIKVNKRFTEEYDRIIRLDCLKDARHALDTMYDEELRKFDKFDC